MSDTAVRDYRPGDLPGLYDVCLRTGATGADASALTDHPQLVGDVYAAPYAVHAPEFVTVLAHGPDVVGYVLGVPDTAAYEAWAQTSWWPQVRDRYAGVEPRTPFDTALLRGIRTGTFGSGLDAGQLARHPAHLHVDLLPTVQGSGWGRLLLQRFFSQLQAAGCPGVHLGVAAANTRARRFYERIGFVGLSSSGEDPAEESTGARTLGLSFSSASS